MTTPKANKFKADPQLDHIKRQLDTIITAHSRMFDSMDERLARLEGTPVSLEALRPTINRLAKEAVMLQLGLTPPTTPTSDNDAHMHGSRWADMDERRLLGAFNSFVRAQSVNLGRTESGIIIRLLRTLRHERPVDWQVAGR